jgi:hypothetical protein
MRKIWLFLGALMSLGMLVLFIWRSPQHSVLGSAIVQKETSLSEKTIRYEQRTLAQSEVHILLIPSQSRFLVTPALSPHLNTVEEFAQKHRAIAPCAARKLEHRPRGSAKGDRHHKRWLF